MNSIDWFFQTFYLLFPLMIVQMEEEPPFGVVLLIQDISNQELNMANL